MSFNSGIPICYTAFESTRETEWEDESGGERERERGRERGKEREREKEWHSGKRETNYFNG